MEEEQTVTTEDILGDFGFRVRWSSDPYRAKAEVFEIVSRNADDWVAGFDLREGPRKGSTTDIDEAELYAVGFVKWDGCSEIDQGQPHWCGPAEYKRHIRLLEYIYRRAFELMGREAESDWDRETEYDAFFA